MSSASLDLPRLLEGLVTIAVGTRSDALVPECVLAMGFHVDRGSSRMTVYVPEATGRRTFANVLANGAVAVVLDRPGTHRSVQLKGRCVDVRPASEEERPVVEACVAAFTAEVAFLGAPLGRVRRLNAWPCRAVTLEVTAVFEQTPGPRAGLPLAAEGAA